MFEILYVWMKAQEASIVTPSTSDAISSLTCTSTRVTTTFTAPYILWALCILEFTSQATKMQTYGTRSDFSFNFLSVYPVISCIYLI